jgi:hypothetical protein
MIQPEQLVEGEWAEWYRLTPIQRWLESEKLWQTYLGLGGSLDPEPDTQSPFFDPKEARQISAKQLGIDRLVRLQWTVGLKKLRHAK